MSSASTEWSFLQLQPSDTFARCTS